MIQHVPLCGIQPATDSAAEVQPYKGIHSQAPCFPLSEQLADCRPGILVCRQNF